MRCWSIIHNGTIKCNRDQRQSHAWKKKWWRDFCEDNKLGYSYFPTNFVKWISKCKQILGVGYKLYKEYWTFRELLIVEFTVDVEWRLSDLKKFIIWRMQKFEWINNWKKSNKFHWAGRFSWTIEAYSSVARYIMCELIFIHVSLKFQIFSVKSNLRTIDGRVFKPLQNLIEISLANNQLERLTMILLFIQANCNPLQCGQIKFHELDAIFLIFFNHSTFLNWVIICASIKVFPMLRQTLILFANNWSLVSLKFPPIM